MNIDKKTALKFLIEHSLLGNHEKSILLNNLNHMQENEMNLLADTLYEQKKAFTEAGKDIIPSLQAFITEAEKQATVNE